MSDNGTSSTGVGLAGLLLIAFIVLKLTNVITWSWWWVMAPLWIPAAITLLLLVVWGTVIMIKLSKRKK